MLATINSSQPAHLLLTPEEHQRTLLDSERLAALERLELLDVPAQPLFDDIAQIAAQLLNTPVALICLVDRERQFFVSSIGVSEPWASHRETPLSHSFCQYAVSSGAPLRVEDARRDPLLYQNGAINELGVIAYLGVPLFFDGQAVGSLCAIDSVPRPWSNSDLNQLERLAGLVMREFQVRVLLAELHIAHHHLAVAESRLRAEVNVDALTHLPNRRAFDGALYQHADNDEGAGVLGLIDLDHFKQVNDRFGHMAGDIVLRTIAAHLRKHCEQHATIYRIGGEEFALFINQPLEMAFECAYEMLRSVRDLQLYYDQHQLPMQTLSVGLASYQAGETPQRWFQRADDALYTAKRSGRDMVVIAKS